MSDTRTAIKIYETFLLPLDHSLVEEFLFIHKDSTDPEMSIKLFVTWLHMKGYKISI